MTVIEVCFCGRAAELTDRLPVVGDGGYGLACPACGHVDTMRWFSEAYRLELWTEAAARTVRTVSTVSTASTAGTPAGPARPLREPV